MRLSPEGSCSTSLARCSLVRVVPSEGIGTISASGLGYYYSSVDTS